MLINGDIDVVNTGDLTTTTGTGPNNIGILAERASFTASQANSGSIRVANSGRIQAAVQGIRAVATNDSSQVPLDQRMGDVSVVNDGAIFSAIYGIYAVADRGLASIDNRGDVVVDTSGFDALIARGLDAAITNSGAIVSDRRNGITAVARGIDATIDIVNTGSILLNDKSSNGVGILAEMPEAVGFSNAGRTRIVNSGDIISTGTRNQAISVTNNGGVVELTSNALLSAQFNALEVLSSNSSGDIQVTIGGAIASTERSGISLLNRTGGDIQVDNSASINAFANGIQAAAAGLDSSVAMVNRGDITIGNATYSDVIFYNNNTAFIPRAALYGLGDRVRIENHGLLTATALAGNNNRVGIAINSSAAGGVAEVVNYGNILFNEPGSNRGSGIIVVQALVFPPVPGAWRRSVTTVI